MSQFQYRCVFLATPTFRMVSNEPTGKDRGAPSEQNRFLKGIKKCMKPSRESTLEVGYHTPVLYFFGGHFPFLSLNSKLKGVSIKKNGLEENTVCLTLMLNF